MKKNRLRREEKRLSILFLAPAIFLIAGVTLVPILYAVRTSFYDTNYTEVQEFAGLKHYIDILSSGEGLQAILNSITYVLLSLLIVIPLGIILAVMLNRKMRGRTVLRTIIIIPWVLSQTVTALLWQWLLNSSYGPVNYLSVLLTGGKFDVFNSPIPAKAVVILANVWNSFPIVLILILAALQSISSEVYEAAQVDGATGIQSFFYITLPLIRPTILTAIVLQSMEYFNMVTLVYTLTSGGPFGATRTLSVLAFQEGFDYWHMGYGSAASVLILILNVFFSMAYMGILNRKGDKSEKG